MTFDDAIEVASRDERFMATVYAMNTFLIHKGIYTQKEFETRFVEWLENEQKKTRRREGTKQRAGFVTA